MVVATFPEKSVVDDTVNVELVEERITILEQSVCCRRGTG